jgi:hypothetical protein
VNYADAKLSMKSSLFASLMLVSASSRGDADPFNKYSLPTLKRMIYVRGLWCRDCTEAEYRTMARENAALTINEALAEEYDDAMAYEIKKKELQITKPEFVQQMNTTAGDSVDEARAERMWLHFLAQLDSGAVIFQENGTMSFSLPVTHLVAPYLPIAVSDAIESSFLACRAVYVQLPRRYRRRLERRLEWTVELGAVHALLACLITVLLMDVGMGAFLHVKQKRKDTQ